MKYLLEVFTYGIGLTPDSSNFVLINLRMGFGMNLCVLQNPSVISTGQENISQGKYISIYLKRLGMHSSMFPPWTEFLGIPRYPQIRKYPVHGVSGHRSIGSRS